MQSENKSKSKQNTGTKYTTVICRKDSMKVDTLMFATYAGAVSTMQHTWDTDTAEDREACTGAGGCFEILADGKPAAVWRAGSDLPELYMYEDAESGNRMTPSAARGLLEHRYTRWQFRCDLTREFGAIKMGRIGREFSAGDVLWAHPKEFEEDYKRELEEMMGDISRGLCLMGIRLTEEFRQEQEE